MSDDPKFSPMPTFVPDPAAKNVTSIGGTVVRTTTQFEGFVDWQARAEKAEAELARRDENRAANDERRKAGRVEWRARRDAARARQQQQWETLRGQRDMARARVAELEAQLADLRFEAHVVIKANSTLSMAGRAVKPSFQKLADALDRASASVGGEKEKSNASVSNNGPERQSAVGRDADGEGAGSPAERVVGLSVPVPRVAGQSVLGANDPSGAQETVTRTSEASPADLDWLVPGAIVEYQPSQLRDRWYAAVVDGWPRALGASTVVRLRDVEPAYSRDHHPGQNRTTIFAASVECVRLRTPEPSPSKSTIEVWLEDRIADASGLTDLRTQPYWDGRRGALQEALAFVRSSPRTDNPKGHTCESPVLESVDHVAYDLRCEACVAMLIAARGPLVPVVPQTETPSPRERALEAALCKIAESEAGDEQAFEWAEFYDSIRRFARNAVEEAREKSVSKGGG